MKSNIVLSNMIPAVRFKQIFEKDTILRMYFENLMSENLRNLLVKNKKNMKRKIMRIAVRCMRYILKRDNKIFG